MGCAGSKSDVAMAHKADPRLQASVQQNGHHPAGAKTDKPPKVDAPPPAVPAKAKQPAGIGAPKNGGSTPRPPTDSILRASVLQMTQDKDEGEDSQAVGELPVMGKPKKRGSIRRATPQVQSMSDSMKRSSREKVAPSSRSSSVASGSISESISE